MRKIFRHLYQTDTNISTLASFNIFTRKIPEAKARRLVISDIHGCLKTFRTIIEKINLTKEDQLFLLGDYVDRGPNSRGVIDYIIDLLKQKYLVYPIRGNHEDSLIKASEDKYYMEVLTSNYFNNLIEKNLSISDNYVEFLNQLPYFFELKDCFIVHAGINFKASDPFTDTEAMLWSREDKYDHKKANNKYLIHGHTPRKIDEIMEAIISKKKVLPLDNGCVYANQNGYGNLICYDIDLQSITTCKNLDLR